MTQMPCRVIACVISLVGTCAFGAELLDPSPPPPTGARTQIFISDLHLGVGHVKQNQTTGDWTEEAWHPLEDFRWASEFDAFLSYIEGMQGKNGTSVDLVLLGDFLELWQTPSRTRDCIYGSNGKVVPPDAVKSWAEQTDGQANLDLSCTASDALKRAQRVIGAHGDVLHRIRQFAQVADNRVTIVPGNHDAALAFPSVSKALMAAIGANDDRVRIAHAGYWRSGDGLIFAEHGHFISGDVNYYSRFPASCWDQNKKRVDCKGEGLNVFLERPWGEQFVQRIFNEYEELYPIVDNLTSEAYGAKIALAEASPDERAKAFAKGFKFFLEEQSIRQFSQALGPEETGEPKSDRRWDVAKIRGERGDRFFVDSLDSDDPLRNAVEQALKEGRLGLSLKDLKDEEILNLCDLRSVRRQIAVQQNRSPTIELCPGPTHLGAFVKSLITTGAQRKSERVEEVRALLPLDGRPTRKFILYVYAHTHAVHGGCTPRAAASRILSEPDGTTWNPVAINTGAWQRLVSPERLASLRMQKPDKPLKDYRPEDLAACYSVVWVNPYDAAKGQTPNADVWFWSKPRGANWDLRGSCDEDPWLLAKDACAD